jgi:single-strand DNA-binding protein
MGAVRVAASLRTTRTEVQMTVNKVILVGRLGADPEVRQTNSGGQAATLRIATTERQKDQDGTWGEHTEWHRVVTFGRTADNVAKYLRKGRQIYIDGRLRTRKWTDRDGNDRYTTEVLTFDIKFLGSKDDQGGGARDYPNNSGGGYDSGGRSGGAGGGGGTSGGGSGDSGGGGGGSAQDDDIPF